MNDYEKQYFNTLLQIATERFVERAVQRSEGVENALHLLRTDPYGNGVWLDKFVDAFLKNFCSIILQVHVLFYKRSQNGVMIRNKFCNKK